MKSKCIVRSYLSTVATEVVLITSHAVKG